MKTAKQLRAHITRLEDALRVIRIAKTKLNPVHFDTAHECGRFMRLVDHQITECLGPEKSSVN